MFFPKEETRLPLIFGRWAFLNTEKSLRSHFYVSISEELAWYRQINKAIINAFRHGESTRDAPWVMPAYLQSLGLCQVTRAALSLLPLQGRSPSRRAFGDRVCSGCRHRAWMTQPCHPGDLSAGVRLQIRIALIYTEEIPKDPEVGQC